MNKSKSKWILGIVTVLHWFSLYTYVPYFTPYMQTLGAIATVTGMAAGAYGFSQMVFRIPIGIGADKLGRQKIFITLGVAMSAVASLGMRLFPNPVALLFFRGLSGLSAASWVCFPILFSSYFKPEDSTKAIGNINAMNNFGRLAATFLGGMVAQAFGMVSSFTLSFAAGVLATILSLFVQDIETEREPLALKELATVAKNKPLILGCILACCLQFIMFATAFAFTSNVAADLGATPMQLSMVTTFFTLTNFIMSLLVGGVFVKNFGEKPVILTAFLMVILYCILVPLVPSVWMICVLQLMGGCSNGLLATILMSMSVRTVELSKKNTAMGAYQAIYGIGMTLGPAIMGGIVNGSGYRLGFLIMGIIAAAAVVLVLLFYNKAVSLKN
ncbi:MFS transporter [Anaerolentibacter hominis]|uniref:MFS transporter n=1 Tax=Anaerolentibacter hominis TaxID=3079009 RepID=UPI0031B806FF